MTRLDRGIKNAMVERGIVNEDWRVKCVSTYQGNKMSDFATVYVETYKPRHRKPTQGWDLTVNIVREQILWDRSTFATFR